MTNTNGDYGLCGKGKIAEEDLLSQGGLSGCVRKYRRNCHVFNVLRYFC